MTPANAAKSSPATPATATAKTAANSAASYTATATLRPRLWPAIVLLGAYWAFRFGADSVEMLMSMRFLSRMLANLLLLLLFSIWWLTNRRVSRGDRWRAFGLVVAGAIVSGLLADKSIGMFAIMFGFPLVFTVWTGWLLVSRSQALKVQRIGFFLLVTAVWLSCDLLRWDGLDGGQHDRLAWRWSPTAEQLFLASRATTKPIAPAAIAPQSGGDAANVAEPSIKVLSVSADDWPEFRGPARDDRVHAPALSLAWNSAAPRQVWSERVGPGWSSMSIVGGLLFTQEQRGEKESVVCYDATSGREIWAHDDPERFSDNLSGPGPRATPTYSEGRLYTLGGRGRLNCLQADNGRLIWSRDIVADSGAPIPMWGFSNSPLVVEGRVVIWAGEPGEKGAKEGDKGAKEVEKQPKAITQGAIAYTADHGEPVWSVPAGKNSYSSPQLVTLGGVEQLLLLSDRGLTSIEPRSGKVIWEQLIASGGMYMPVAQAQVVGENLVLLPHPNGVALVEVNRQGDGWTTKQRWESKSLKPTLNDFVVCDDSIYGFDDGIFCCLDLHTGKRRWKQGRYGHGQVLLLAEQKELLVLSESGEAVLLAANPQKLEELGRFQAIHGRTWNHPVLAHGKLYARNGEEMACFDLGQSVVR